MSVDRSVGRLVHALCSFRRHISSWRRTAILFYSMLERRRAIPRCLREAVSISKNNDWDRGKKGRRQQTQSSPFTHFLIHTDFCIYTSNSFNILFYSILLYCIVLYCIVLYCIVLYCILFYPFDSCYNHVQP